MHERLRHILLTKWTSAVCDHPRLAIVIACIVTVASLAVTAALLTFQSDRNDLLSRDLEWNKRFISLNNNFHGNDDLIVSVLIPQTEGGLELARKYVTALGQKLTSPDNHIEEVYYRADLRELSSKMLLTLPLDEMNQNLKWFESSKLLLQSNSIDTLLQNISALLLQQAAAPASSGEEDNSQVAEQVKVFTQFLDAINNAFLGKDVEEDLQRILLTDGFYEYLVSDDGKLLFMFLQPKLVEDALDPYLPAIEDVRTAMAELRASYPEFGLFNKDQNAGITGIAVMEADETVTSINDSTKCSIIALSLIVVLIILSFHGWQFPTLALLALLFGVAWSFGFLTLAIGHLQVLSVVFAVILLGLGIDFGIHLISTYELVRHQYDADSSGCKPALIHAMQIAGPGIFTGAITTAVAFAATLLTDFQGMAEMGLIASVGILLCLISMFTLLPALILLLRPKAKHVPPSSKRYINLHGLHILNPIVNRPYATLLIFGVLLIPAILLAQKVPFDYNLQHLQAEGVESVVWQDHIAEHHQAIMSAVSVTTDLEQAEKWTHQFRNASTVHTLGGIANIFSDQMELRNQSLARTRAAITEPVLNNIPPAAENVPSAQQILSRLLGFQFILSQATRVPSIQSNPEMLKTVQAVQQKVIATNEQIKASHAAGDAKQNAATLHKNYSAFRDIIIEQTKTLLAERALVAEDQPPVLLRDGVSHTTPVQYAIRIFPKADVWNPANLEAFVNELRTIDPTVTGLPVQLYESSMLIQTSYFYAGIYAFVAVFLLVLVDFRNPIDAFIAMLPVLFGFVGMFAVMHLINIPVNLANIIILPLLFGVGVDCGVHIVHRYRQTPTLNPPGLALGTGKGIFLTTLTTMIGFGAMILAHHRGIQSLGLVLSIGMAITLIGCFTVMPAVLAIYRKIKMPRAHQQIDIPENY